MRRVDINGSTTLMDYCTPAVVRERRVHRRLAVLEQHRHQRHPAAVPGAKQQLGGWSNGVWNQVFAGVQGAPRSRSRARRTRRSTRPRCRARSRSSTSTRAGASTSTSPTCSSTRRARPGERPDAGPLAPDRRASSSRRPTDSAQIINALSPGKNLIFTPGVYDVDRTIEVKRADTIVLGLGMATLDAPNGVVAMTVGDVPGVEISGLIFDAGPVNSPVLLQVGRAHGDRARRAGSDPTRPDRAPRRVLPDRRPARRQGDRQPRGQQRQRRSSTTSGPGGPTTATGVGWTSNTADTGVVVNGDNVTATGLFVEHYQSYNVIWNGENGKTIIFQNELPYDPPTQAAWQHDGVLGYAAYKVATGEDARGLGPRQLLLLQRRPDDPRDPRLRGAGHPGRQAARHLTVSITNKARSTTSSTTSGQRRPRTRARQRRRVPDGVNSTAAVSPALAPAHRGVENSHLAAAFHGRESSSNGCDRAG